MMLCLNKCLFVSLSFSRKSSVLNILSEMNEGDDDKYLIVRKSVAFITDDRVHSYELKVVKPGEYTIMFFKKRKDKSIGWDYDSDAIEGYKSVKCYGLTGIGDATVLYTVTRPRNGRPKYVMVYAHGNTWDLGALHRPLSMGMRADGSVASVDDVCRNKQNLKRSLVQHMADKLGCVVVSFEYPGYGERHSETNWPRGRADTINNDVNSLERAPRYMARVIEWAYNTFYVRDRLPCVVYGYSIGAAVAVECLVRVLPEHLKSWVQCNVMLAAFWSLNGVTGNGVYEKVALAGLRALGLLDAYDISRLIRDLDVPTVYVHGQRDDVCPMQGAYDMLYLRHPAAHSFNVLGPYKRKVGSRYVKVNSDHRDVLLHPLLYRVVKKQVGEILSALA